MSNHTAHCLAEAKRSILTNNIDTIHERDTSRTWQWFELDKEMKRLIRAQELVAPTPAVAEEWLAARMVSCLCPQPQPFEVWRGADRLGTTMLIEVRYVELINEADFRVWGVRADGREGGRTPQRFTVPHGAVPIGRVPRHDWHEKADADAEWREGRR